MVHIDPGLGSEVWSTCQKIAYHTRTAPSFCAVFSLSLSYGAALAFHALRGHGKGPFGLLSSHFWSSQPRSRSKGKRKTFQTSHQNTPAWKFCRGVSASGESAWFTLWLATKNKQVFGGFGKIPVLHIQSLTRASGPMPA